ncbi:MAG: PQ-loop repeat-containing protein [Mycoplasma sp.]|nr:PQ-loop repeat-containing protein [Mycoplasma sp.]
MFTEMNTLEITSFILGVIASLCISIYTIPQLIMLIKSKNSSGISAPMFLILIIGDLFFIIQGIVGLFNFISSNEIVDWFITLFPILLANVICVICGSITLTIKLQNYFRAKKANISESEYCNKLFNKSKMKKHDKKRG